VNDIWLHSLLRDCLNIAKRISVRMIRPPVVSVTPIRYVDTAFEQTVLATPPFDGLESELQADCAACPRVRTHVPTTVVARPREAAIFVIITSGLTQTIHFSPRVGKKLMNRLARRDRARNGLILFANGKRTHRL
jgi:hypothetical protein